MLPFTGVPKNAGEYTFNVRQTYSDGSVVEWSGAESSDTPAARIAATSADSSSGGSDRHGQDARHHRARARRRGTRRRRRALISGRRST